VTPETLLVGCGRLGGAILSGWMTTGAPAMSLVGIQSPSVKKISEQARAQGASLNPTDLSGVKQVVLAVKPAKWPEVGEVLSEHLPTSAVVVSVMAGVSISALRAGLGGRAVARVMPTTAVSVGEGVATCLATDAGADGAVARLFGGIAELVWVENEAMIDVATALSGSGAAYAYAFVRDLAAAGERRGLTQEQALTLARRTVAGALARLAEGSEVQALIDEVASPGGTTRAGLDVLEPGLGDLIDRTVEAALSRARGLSR